MKLTEEQQQQRQEPDGWTDGRITDVSSSLLARHGLQRESKGWCLDIYLKDKCSNATFDTYISFSLEYASQKWWYKPKIGLCGDVWGS